MKEEHDTEWKKKITGQVNYGIYYAAIKKIIM